MPITNPWPIGIGGDGAVAPGSALSGCVDWYTQQLQGSFRGIPFAVDSDGRTGGRRVVVHEYPNREVWDGEDLGNQKITVDVRAYVYGDEVIEWASILFEACNTNLPQPYGMLYLPMRPPNAARCMSVTSEFKADSLGRINFEMRFVLECPINLTFTLTQTMAAKQVAKGAATLQQAIIEDFKIVTAVNFPASSFAAASSEITIISRKLRVLSRQFDMLPDLSAKVDASIRVLLQDADAVAYSLRRRSSAFTATSFSGGQDAAVSYRSRYNLSGDLTDILQRMLEGARGKKSSAMLARSLSNVTDYFGDTVVGDAGSAFSEQVMRSAVAGLVRRMALAYQAAALVDDPPTDPNKFAQIEKRFMTRLKAELDLVESNNALRSAINDLLTRWTSYSAIIHKLFQSDRKAPAGRPLAVLAATLYGGQHGDRQRDRELMVLNGIRHPLYVFEDIMVSP